MKRLALLLLLLASPASAGENLVSGLSQDKIEIRSTYNGTDIVVFGAVERPQAAALPDIVVVVRGPRDRHARAPQGPHRRHLDQP